MKELKNYLVQISTLEFAIPEGIPKDIIVENFCEVPTFDADVPEPTVTLNDTVEPVEDKPVTVNVVAVPTLPPGSLTCKAELVKLDVHPYAVTAFPATVTVPAG